MTNVVGIHGAAVMAAPESDEEIVSQLEEFLAEAKDGVITGIAFAVVRPTGTTTTWSGRADKHEMIAALAMLNHRFIAAALAQDEE